MDTVIRVENLTKIYKLYDKPIDRLKESLSIMRKQYHKEHFALNDISFNIKKGETIGIIGTNGSGKSTLLKILTGVLNPTSGFVEVKGKVSALLELGAGFNPEYTGLENIYLNGTMLGYSKEEINLKLPEILKFADIGEFIHQPVKTYSSGMFARLAFSVAINVEPEILIVDEALSVGDVFFQNKCFRKFEYLKKMGVTILFVSHDLSSVRQMCSKVLWIEKGNQIMYEDATNVCKLYFNKQIEKNANNVLDTGKVIETDLEYYNLDDIRISTNTISKLKNKPDDIISEKVEIISVDLFDQEKRKINDVIAGSRCSLRILLRSNSNIKNAILGFSIEDSKGIAIIGDNTYAKNKKNFEIKENTMLAIEFDFYIPLIKKGEYVITVALAIGIQEDHYNIIWMHSVDSFSIIKNGYDLAMLNADSNISIKTVKRI